MGLILGLWLLGTKIFLGSYRDMSDEDRGSILYCSFIHILLCGSSFLVALSFVTVFSAIYATKTIEMRMKELAVNLLLGSFYFGFYWAALLEFLYNPVYMLYRILTLLIKSAFP
jgi:hypothetical protein